MDELLREKQKKTERIGFVLLLIVAGFFALVCTPVSIWSSTDIIIAETVFPTLWDMLLGLVQFLFYWVAFAFFIFLAKTYGLGGTKRFLLLYLACLVIRYAVSLGVSYWMLRGSMELGSILTDLAYLLVDILGDCLQMAVLLFTVWIFIAVRPLPHSLSICVWSAALIPCVLIRIPSRVWYDCFIGAPKNLADLIWMIVYYCLDILLIPLGYFAIGRILALLSGAFEES